MKESLWLTTNAVLKMTLFVASSDGNSRRKAGRRKLRLFGCFACRQMWEQMTDERSRRAVEVAERLADDQATPAEVRRAWQEADKARMAADSLAWQGGDGYRRAMAARAWLADDEQVAATSATSVLDGQWRQFSCRGLSYRGNDSTALSRSLCPARRRVQADALRCIFGNVFHRVTVEPLWFTWNDGTLGRMAQSIYEDRSWNQLPVLGDALEDAGCTHEAMLAHCRRPGVHTRGCWVVDLLLGLS